MSSRLAFLSVFFAVCLYPYSYARSDAVAFSVNYLFLLLPLSQWLLRGTIVRPPTLYVLLMIMYSGIFWVAAAYQFEHLPFLLRRITSFLLFMTMFVFMFTRIDEEMVKAFKVGVVAFSCLFALSALVAYLDQGGTALGAGAKDIVGSSRVGFVYVLAVWILAQEKTNLFSARSKYAALVIVGIGLLLTFSRASVFALLGSIVLYGISSLAAWLCRPRVAISRQSLASLVMLPLIVFVVVRAVPGTLEFFDETFVELVADRPRLVEHVTDPYYSEGFRIFLALQVVEFVTRNPFTGSGFLGVWVLSDDLTGSTHNQLVDVLFRTGWLGFVGYLFLLWRLFKYLYRYDKGMFWGAVGILLYGNFHETFKESQGAFIIAFLLGLMSQRPDSRFLGRRAGSRFPRGHPLDAVLSDEPRGAPVEPAQSWRS